MGQGGGCYDKALPRRRAGVPVVVLLHPGELLGPDDEPLPREPHDVPVDAVLTADGVTDLRPQAPTACAAGPDVAPWAGSAQPVSPCRAPGRGAGS